LNMAPIDQKTEVVPPAEVPEDLPLPADPKAIFLGGLFVLAVLAAAYVASEIVLPLVFAILLKLLLQRKVRGRIQFTNSDPWSNCLAGFRSSLGNPGCAHAFYHTLALLQIGLIVARRAGTEAREGEGRIE